jgi:HEAT repeat protein
VVTDAFWPERPPFTVGKGSLNISHEDADVVPVLLHLTHHPRPNVRWWATEMLCLSLPLNDDAIARLIELLDDPEDKVVKNAVLALSYRRQAARAAIPKLRQKAAEARQANSPTADVFTEALSWIDPATDKP